MELNTPEEKSIYIKCSKCHIKYLNDDEHIKTDFGYNRLGERIKTCTKCRDKQLKYREAHRAELKEKQCNRRKETKGIVDDLIKEFKEHDKDNANSETDIQTYINEILICEVCGSIKPRRLMVKHTNTPLCKRTANVIRYEELHGGTYTCMYKHIANGDVDFDGVIKLEEHEKRKYGWS